MNKTKIEWVKGYTWNPITGCKHDCEYCYARNIANRFKGFYSELVGGNTHEYVGKDDKGIYELNEPVYRYDEDDKMRKAAYPFGFKPTFHKYRLKEPTTIRTSKNIFVCSMADLFGEMVPEEWIAEVIHACESASQHNYLFLTKNPQRYRKVWIYEMLTYINAWLGVTITSEDDVERIVDMPAYAPLYGERNPKKFVSIEPLLSDLPYVPLLTEFDWVIIGAESGNRKDKIVPKKEWIDNIVEMCKSMKVPVFMKESLLPIMGEENMLREFPEELKNERK